MARRTKTSTDDWRKLQMATTWCATYRVAHVLVEESGWVAIQAPMNRSLVRTPVGTRPSACDGTRIHRLSADCAHRESTQIGSLPFFVRDTAGRAAPSLAKSTPTTTTSSSSSSLVQSSCTYSHPPMLALRTDDLQETSRVRLLRLRFPGLHTPPSRYHKRARKLGRNRQQHS